MAWTEVRRKGRGKGCPGLSNLFQRCSNQSHSSHKPLAQPYRPRGMDSARENQGKGNTKPPGQRKAPDLKPLSKSHGHRGGNQLLELQNLELDEQMRLPFMWQLPQGNCDGLVV